MTFLSLSNLTFGYARKTILHDISLSIETGEVVCLLGPSGCGKSTLLRLIAGLIPMQYGSIKRNNKDITKTAPEKRDMGLVFQHPSLFPHLTINDNITFAHADLKAASNALKSMQLTEYQESYPHMLSGGQQQRAAIARALAHKPKLLLLDEPFSHLDVVLRKSIREETLNLIRDKNLTTLMVTHDPEDAIRMADRIYIMQEGLIIQSGTPHGLYSMPLSPFVASLFGELNKLPAKYIKGCLETDIGKLKYSNPPKNPIVYIRPEHIEISKNAKDSVKAKVLDIHFMGATSLVYLQPANNKLHLRARITQKSLPKTGDDVYIKCKEFLVF